MTRTTMEGIDFPPDKIVIVDFDGTVADFDGAVREGAAQRGIHPIDSGPPSFYTAENYKKEDQAAVWQISNAAGFARNLAPLPGLILGWMSMIEAGFHPVIGSTLLPFEYSPTNEADKLGWLEEYIAPHVGLWVIDEAVFTPNKHELSAAGLIDDKPSRMMKHKGLWTHIIFTQPPNIGDDPSNTLRITGWEDPELIPILIEAQKRFKALQNK